MENVNKIILTISTTIYQINHNYSLNLGLHLYDWKLDLEPVQVRALRAVYYLWIMKYEHMSYERNWAAEIQLTFRSALLCISFSIFASIDIIVLEFNDKS